MTLDGPAGCERDGTPWSPRFIDYVFLAFNTSTAFSPTDVPVLGRWAKVLMMTQAVISLTIIALLIGRGVQRLLIAGELHDLFAIPFERNLVHVVYLCALGTTLLVLRPPPTSRT